MFGLFKKKEQKYSKEETLELVKIAVNSSIRGTINWLKSDDVTIRYIKSKKNVLGAEIHGGENSANTLFEYIKAELAEEGIVISYKEDENI